MKFESKFGIGEVVINTTTKNGDFVADQIYKITGFVFDKEETAVLCRHPTSGMIVMFKEYELIGDPDFKQDSGEYPYDEHE